MAQALRTCTRVHRWCKHHGWIKRVILALVAHLDCLARSEARTVLICLVHATKKSIALVRAPSYFSAAGSLRQASDTGDVRRYFQTHL